MFWQSFLVYDIIEGNRLKDFELSFFRTGGKEVNFLTKISKLGIFNFRAE